MPRKKKTTPEISPDPEIEALSNISVFMDTRDLMPGMVVYTVAPTAPTNQVPYPVYHIEPRVITQIHDSGVNGGTIFTTYKHFISHALGNTKKVQINCEEETLYSPLTKEHAEYVAKMLTEQSKTLYIECCKSKQQSK